ELVNGYEIFIKYILIFYIFKKSKDGNLSNLKKNDENNFLTHIAAIQT
ncbi:MAG: hypothetical protein RLZZ546_521, partial [Bacteroidota bacterium]